MANEIMLQAFEWYLPEDQNHWKWLKKEVEKLKAAKISMDWL